MLTIGSLFSGIGGIDLGLERAGFKVIWQVEINEYRQKVLGKYWPDVARYGDIRTVGKRNLTPVDLICGGFPCQPHSLAGRRRGGDDERNLWPEFYRILCELRPAWMLAENVPGLLSSDDGRFFGGILRDLAALGYDAEWQVLSAEAIGAPHLRERVFLVAYTQYTRSSCSRGGDESESSFYRSINTHPEMADSTCEQRNGGRFARHGWDEFTNGSQVIPDADRQSLAVGQVFGRDAAKELAAFKRSCSTGAGQWAVEPDVDRVASRVPARVERLGGIGDSVVPQCAEYVGRCIRRRILKLAG